MEQVCGPLPWRILDSKTQSISLSMSLPEYISAVCRWKDMPINRARNPELDRSFAIPAISLVHSAIIIPTTGSGGHWPVEESWGEESPSGGH